MTLWDLEYRELIFDLLNGEYNYGDYPVPESALVKSEFETGGMCDTLYAQMLYAYSRLCDRLQTEDQNDADVEIIINNLLEIGRHLTLKMFEYGVLLTQRELMPAQESDTE